MLDCSFRAALPHSGNVMRFDFQKDPMFAGFPIRIFFLASVLLRHLVDMILSFASRDLFDDSSSNHYELVRIPLFCDRHGNLWVLLDVSMLDTTHGRVNENVVTVSINPSWSNLRRTISIYCGEEDEILTFEDLSCIIIEFHNA